jgi:ATP-dependent Clp protease ATP-binding subunit ClpA
VFKTLSKEDIKKIVKLEIDKLSSRLTNLKFNLTFDDSVIELISEVGYDEIYGARPLKRAIQDKIEDFISEEVLNGRIIENTQYKVLSVEKEVKIEPIVKKGRKKKGE